MKAIKFVFGRVKFVALRLLQVLGIVVEWLMETEHGKTLLDTLDEKLEPKNDTDI